MPGTDVRSDARTETTRRDFLGASRFFVSSVPVSGTLVTRFADGGRSAGDETGEQRGVLGVGDDALVVQPVDLCDLALANVRRGQA